MSLGSGPITWSRGSGRRSLGHISPDTALPPPSPRDGPCDAVASARHPADPLSCQRVAALLTCRSAGPALAGGLWDLSHLVPLALRPSRVGGATLASS